MSKQPRRCVSMSTVQQVLVSVVDDTLRVMPDTDLEPVVRLQACQNLTAACVADKGSPHEADCTVRLRKSHRARQAFVVLGSGSLSG
jgi:hypothetical protein